MSAAVYTACTKCGGKSLERSRAEIADKVREAFHLALREPTDWTKRFQTLGAHLLWLEAELRGMCTNCVLAQASEAFAEFSVEAVLVKQDVPQPLPDNVRPIRRDLGARFARRNLSVPDPKDSP